MTKLLQSQTNLIFGTLLGDGNLQTENNGRTWRYRAVHTEKHKPYLFHKYEILKPLCSSPPAYAEVFDFRTEGTYKRYYFNTTQQTSLNFFGNMFYTYNVTKSKWVKDVPLKVKKFLTPEALAYLYMDDGALKWLNKSNAMRICTENFSEEGVNRLQNALKDLYNIKTNLNKKIRNDGTIGKRIAIPEESSADFRELIKPYLVDCMKYKVSDGNRGHL